MNRAQWETLIRQRPDSRTIAHEALRASWQLPCYIGEAITPPLFLADVALHVMALLHTRHSRRGNPYRVAALTIMGGSAYLEPVDSADARGIVMVIGADTDAFALADALAFSSDGAVLRELARIGRLVRSLDDAGKGKK